MPYQYNKETYKEACVQYYKVYACSCKIWLWQREIFENKLSGSNIKEKKRRWSKDKKNALIDDGDISLLKFFIDCSK